MRKLTLITGGARSGKSAQAIKLANLIDGARYFIATAEARDDEMRERIAHHRRSRPADYAVVEEPQYLALKLDNLAGRAGVVVIDCLTLWVSNLITVYGSQENQESFDTENSVLASSLRRAAFPVIVVTDEVGSGIVPVHPVARRFRDLLGRTNQQIAALADEVLLMVAGIPLQIK